MAEASLALMRARSKFGIAIAAMIRMIATTISNSINEKPFCLRILLFCPLLGFEPLSSVVDLGLSDPDLPMIFALPLPLFIITKVCAFTAILIRIFSNLQPGRVFESCLVSRHFVAFCHDRMTVCVSFVHP